MIVDIKRLKKHYETYEPTLNELRHKYESAMKEKMLMRLERDRMAARLAALEAQVLNWPFRGEGEWKGGHAYHRHSYEREQAHSALLLLLLLLWHPHTPHTPR